MNQTTTESAETLAPYVLTGVLPAEPQPSAAPAEQTFNPLEGLDTEEA